MRRRFALAGAGVGLALGAAAALAQAPGQPSPAPAQGPTEPAPGGEPTSEALSAEEVLALFNGNTEVTIAMKLGVPTGRKYHAFYERDGTYRLAEAAGKTKATGKGSWFVDPLGRHCFRPDAKDKTKCDVIVREGDSYIRLRDGERRGQMTIQKGNPFDL